jgi:hypothetical protein
MQKIMLYNVDRTILQSVQYAIANHSYWEIKKKGKCKKSLSLIEHLIFEYKKQMQ